MKKIILILVLSFAVTLSYAQINNTDQDSKNMISYSRSFWTGVKFSVDGKQVSRAEVDEMLKNSAASANEFKKYREYKKTTTYVGLAAIAFLITPLIAENFKINSTPGKVSVVIGYGMIIPLVIFGSKRDKHYGRAFDAYNQQFR